MELDLEVVAVKNVVGETLLSILLMGAKIAELA